MNVTHTKSTRECPDFPIDLMSYIWDAQEALHDKYKLIEATNGIGWGILGSEKFTFHRPKSQYYLKDLIYRVIEELCEADEAYETHGSNSLHFHEELIDALHFYVELLIVSEVEPRDVLQEGYLPCEPGSVSMYSIIVQLGLAGNCLKQKPWKQTYVPTDVDLFKEKLIIGFKSFWTYLEGAIGHPCNIFDLYFRKNAVNKFRQDSNY